MPKIQITTLTAFIIPLVILDPSGEIAATVLSAVIHELGHVCMLLTCRVGIRSICITPYGFEIATARKYRSFYEEIAVNCAGCIFNFLCCFLLFNGYGFARSLAFASLLLGILNSLPILCLDGGEVLRAVLSIFTGYKRAEVVSRAVSFITLFLLWSFAAYVFFFSGYNYSLFIMSVWLFGKIFCNK